MADAMFMYAVTTGIFAFLAAILFGSRGARRRKGGGSETTPETSSSKETSGKKIKRYNSDGKPVYE